MTRLRNTILNYCGLFQYVKAMKPKKIVGESVFKNHLKFQNFDKDFYCDMDHGTIIGTGITCKKIPCYMRDSACRWFIVGNAKIFRSYVKHF